MNEKTRPVSRHVYYYQYYFYIIYSAENMVIKVNFLTIQ